VGLDLAVVAAAVLVLDDVPGLGAIGAPVLADVAQPHAWSWAMHNSTGAWLVRKLQSATPANSYGSFLEIHC
jgi:hypothetical protein